MADSWRLEYFSFHSPSCVSGGYPGSGKENYSPSTAVATKNFTCPENTELFLWTVSRGWGWGGIEKGLTTLKPPLCPKLVLSDGGSKTRMLAVFVVANLQ